MDYDEQEYNEFIGYIKCTWKELIEMSGDWIVPPTIKRIVVDLNNNEFTVGVQFDEKCAYYRFNDKKELIIEQYDGKYIKTTYYANSEIILFMLLKGDVVSDLALKDIEISINTIGVDYLPTNEYLTKMLEINEESYAETMYCIAHDL